MRRAACLAGFSVLIASPAAAEGPGDARLAQALFDEARTLMEQKRYPEACPKLKESQRLDPGGGTLLNLAACHAAEGKTATALDEYREALGVANRDGRKDRIEVARAAIERLDRDVPRVTVLVPHPVTGLDVKLDTTPLAAAAWGVATPVDPGPHAVTASAPGYVTVTVHVDVRSGERKVVEVPATRKEQAATAAPLPPVVTSGAPATKANPVFWAGLGTGLAALGVSAVTGVLTITNTISANADCSEPRTYCKDAAAKDSLSSARTFGWISTIALGVGAVGIVVALVAPSRKVITALGPAGIRF